eukprot:5305825-Pyramimonas_sp.AAC.1
MSRTQRCASSTRASSVLSYYTPTAERLDYLHVLTPKSTTILDMNTTEKIFHISSSVEKLSCVRTTFDDFTHENNQWVFGWVRYHHGPHWPHAMALARCLWINALPAYMIPRGIDTRAHRDHGQPPPSFYTF